MMRKEDTCVGAHAREENGFISEFLSDPLLESIQ
jgi:hypothetical protein